MKFYAPTKLSENIRETPEGYLLCIGVPITRTGELKYGKNETPLEVGDDGIAIATRSEEDVFHPDTIASFEGKAVTITHPKEFVCPDNWNELAKGHMQNIRRGEGEESNDLLADLLIMDAVAIGLVKNGLREVSCGYEAEYIQTEKGRGKQTKIVGNHLALVEKGRAGQSYAINDHDNSDGKGIRMSAKIKEALKKLLGQTIDAATIDEDINKEKAKPDQATDEGAKIYDAIAAKMKDINGLMEQLKPKAQDAPVNADPTKAVEEQPAKDEGSDLESRLKALEQAVATLLDSQSKATAGDADEEEEETEDTADMEDQEEMNGMTGDAASRAEILSPGIKPSKTMKVDALKNCYKTKDGKKIIDSLSGGKTPTFDAATVDTLFIAASELMKATRTRELSKSKQVTDNETVTEPNAGSGVSAEDLNAMNEKFYKKK